MSHADRVKELFDSKAPTWSEKYNAGGRLIGRMSQFDHALHIHVPTAGRVLDLGCGTGELARSVAAAGMQVMACDISAEMLARAAERDPDGAVSWVQLDPDWRALPLEPAIFHAVIASSLLEYVEDPFLVLAECARVLRPDGVILCTIADPIHPVRWAEWMAGAITRLPPFSTVTGRWRRLERYLIYLRVSRHRHTASWWHAAGVLSGVCPAKDPSAPRRITPLRLLCFQKPGQKDGN